MGRYSKITRKSNFFLASITTRLTTDPIVFPSINFEIAWDKGYTLYTHVDCDIGIMRYSMIKFYQNIYLLKNYHARNYYEKVS